MKCKWSMLVAAIAASPAFAQPSQLPTATPSVPLISMMDSPGTPPVIFPVPADAGADPLSGNHNHVHFINWMSNVFENIDPRAVTAIYPIFGSAWVKNSAPIPDSDFQVYGPTLTIALSDRFAMGVNQGGYAVAHFDRDPAKRDRLFQLDPEGRFRDVETSGKREGWLNIGGFFQYTLIDDVENQFLLTGGMRWIAPCGSNDIFQGHGPFELAPYLTVGKEFGKFHVLATTGYQFPAGPGNDDIQVYYANVHLDRECFGWLYPLVEVNTSWLAKSVDVGLPTRRGFIDFGNFEAEGNIVTLAVGANAVLVPEHLEIGAVYSKVLASQHNFDVNSLLVKMTLRY